MKVGREKRGEEVSEREENGQSDMERDAASFMEMMEEESEYFSSD